MTFEIYPRLSDKALQILAACTEEFRTSHDIAADAGMAGTGLTAWVGAYERETRAKWRGTGRSDSYWALMDISEQGNAFTASLVDLGYVELRKDKRRVLIKITPKGRQALLASELGQTRIQASNDDDKSLGDQNTFNGEGQEKDNGPQSLGDEMTSGGGMGQGGPQSLGDEATFGGGGSVDDAFDDDMEVVDLTARYTTEGMLGKGGMGEVLLATDTRLNRKVAIKRILGSAARSKTAVSRFLNEAQSIAALNHPNIVQIHDYGRAKDGPFLIMEYVEGNSLLDKCREGALPLEEAVDLTCQLCDGLSKAHAANIVHRDIKPANVLLTEDGVPKLTDFGLAKDEAADTGMTMAGAVLGTLDFMSPEQRKDAALTDARSDLWSLAATLYQMVTGESPKVIRIKKVPTQLQDLIDKALEEAKDDRYQTALELKDALKQALHGGADTSDELEQGECPNCGTKNEASRKFCRNTACAGSLEATCLSCSASIPMWEGVCGNCGSIQADLLDQRREQMAAEKLEAESCLAEHNFARATELAREIGNEADPRLQQLKSWSDEFTEQVESTRLAEIGKVEQAIAEALSHEQVYDYRSGMKALRQIPSALLAAPDVPEAESARGILARLQEKHSSAETLEAEIKSRIKARNLSGLLSKVEALLELLPERTDLLKLQQQLQKRESDLEKARLKTLAAAKESIQQHDYAGAVSVIAKLKPEQIDNELDELRSLASAREARSQELCTQVRQAVNNHQYDGLLAPIEEYLTLKPHDADALKSRDELLAREKKKQAEAAALLAQQREEAKKKHAVAKELAAKQRSRQLQIRIGAAIAAAFVLILTVMFYLRAQGIASDISDALSRGDYAAALELDPENGQARVMKQNAEDLASTLRRGDYRAALQLDPRNIEALSMKQAAELQQALSDGDYATALQLDPTNAEGLSIKKKVADLQQALASGDYAAALQLDPSNAEALSMKK